MSTVKIILRKNYKKKNGSYPITMRITQNRKSRFIFTGEYIQEKDWNEKEGLAKKSHPNSARLNNFLLKKLSEAHDIALDVQTNDLRPSVTGIRKKITGGDKKEFFEVSKIFLNNLKKRNKFNQHYNQSKRIDIFKTFLGRQELNFIDLDVTLLKGFETHLLYERKVSQRTAINYLMLIRTIYNFSRVEYDIDDSNYPFGKGKIQLKFPETEKIGLNREEVRLLENVEGVSEAQQNAVNVWLLSFYFAGIRVGDVLKLKWSDFKDGRLYYRMGKNKKQVSLSIPNKAQLILDKYEKNRTKNNLVFPFFR
jgi:integrase